MCLSTSVCLYLYNLQLPLQLFKAHGFLPAFELIEIPFQLLLPLP